MPRSAGISSSPTETGSRPAPASSGSTCSTARTRPPTRSCSRWPTLRLVRSGTAPWAPPFPARRRRVPNPVGGRPGNPLYPLSIEFDCKTMQVTHKDFDYGDSVNGVGQGHVGKNVKSAPGPKGWFAPGDHDVLQYGHEYLDPSYG